MCTCPACRSAIPDESRYCDQCGVQLPSDRDRRGAVRFPVEVEITWESEHNFYTGLTSNLSCGGLFVATHQPASLGDLVEVTFTLPGLGHPCAARCEVRWTREFNPDSPEVPPGLGLRFTALEPQVWSCIERFIRRRESIFYDDDEL